MSRRQLVLTHLFFWFVIISMSFSYMILGSQANTFENIFGILVKTSFECIDFYLFYSLIIPEFFLKRKNNIAFIGITVLYVLAYTSIFAVGLVYFTNIFSQNNEWVYLKIYFLTSLYYTILYIILGALLKLAIEGLKSQQKNIILEKQNIKSELAMLRTQINPHFLFNTLNTIHAYIKSDADKAANSVIELSDIMRYMLHDSSRESITLKKEIEYLKSYIRLQVSRFEKPDFVDFKTTIDNDGILIPPMLFISFVENAFKHGEKEMHSTGIGIAIKQFQNVLLFETWNYIKHVKNKEFEEAKGIGLNNIRRRLDLLFSEHYKLDIHKDEQRFSVKLQIDLV